MNLIEMIRQTVYGYTPAISGFGVAPKEKASASLCCMNRLFSSPKSAKRPAAPRPPTPPPTIETSTQANEATRTRRQSGTAETFLTGDLVPEKKKKTTLG
jgi:hypothetical protein